MWAIGKTRAIRTIIRSSCEDSLKENAVLIENQKTGKTTSAVYEHPYIVRLCHWLNTIALFVMIGSGLQIFRAFPSFGAKFRKKL